MSPFSILYEDSDMFVVDKPEGLASIPEREKDRDNLLQRLSERYSGKIYIVHRIDKDVSGAMVFARNAEAHKRLCLQFEKRQVSKKYTAVTLGVMGPEGGEINKPIRQFGSGRMGVDEKKGKPCITRFKVVERWPSHTLVEAMPVTGRRHQIRVHFYSIGHALAGDPSYGDGKVQAKYPRLMLHSTEIGLKAPSGRPLTVCSPLPQSFSNAALALKG